MNDGVVERCTMLLLEGLQSGEIEFNDDLVFELMEVLGTVVFSLEWDSGGPGAGAGSETVYRLGEAYLKVDTEGGWYGPFGSLDEALDEGIWVSSAVKAISCSEWTDDEIVARLKIVGNSVPRAIAINYREWTPEGGLEPEEEDETAGATRDADEGSDPWLIPASMMESGDGDPAPATPAEAPPEAEVPVVDGPANAEDGEEPHVIIARAYRGPDGGGIAYTSGPPDPLGIRTDELRRADGLLRTGMVALDKCEPRQLDRAERCFREALYLLTGVWEEPHPRISYALDRIGLVRHLRGDLQEAEKLYLRSLEVLGEDDRPTPWNDVTLLNLAALYQSKGRGMEAEAVIAYFRGNDGEGAS